MVTISGCEWQQMAMKPDVDSEFWMPIDEDKRKEIVKAMVDNLAVSEEDFDETTPEWEDVFTIDEFYVDDMGRRPYLSLYANFDVFEHDGDAGLLHMRIYLDEKHISELQEQLGELIESKQTRLLKGSRIINAEKIGLEETVVPDNDGRINVGKKRSNKQFKLILVEQ